MSDDIYRPLFVMVEAIEAEAKRLLEPPKPKFDIPKPSQLVTGLRVIEREFRRRYKDLTLSFDPAAHDAVWRLWHRCSLCTKVHALEVTEQQLRVAEFNGPCAVVDLMIDKCDALYALPCALELGRG